MSETNNLTQQAIRLLSYEGFTVWRNGNHAVYSIKRKAFMKNPTTKLGVTDIIGYHNITGKAIFVEIKTGKDKLSAGQTEFINSALKSNCIAFVIRNIDELIAKIKELK